MIATKFEYCCVARLVSVLSDHHDGDWGCVLPLGALSQLSYDGPLPRHYLLFSPPTSFFCSQPPLKMAQILS
jgi:hypothetical protein